MGKDNSYPVGQPSEQRMKNRLQSSLTNLFSLSQGWNDDGDSSTQYEVKNNFELGVGVPSIESSSTEDAPLLNEEMYINSEKYMNSDGSIVVESSDAEVPRGFDTLLSSLMNDAPEIPSDEYMQSKELYVPTEPIVDDDALLSSLSDRSSNMKPTYDSEELHRLVFSNEKGFLEQSEAFRDSLSPDSDQEKKKEAETLRRGIEYRHRQEEAMARILREMDELEKTALTKEDAVQLSTLKNLDSSMVLCSKCSCRLSAEEVTREKRRGRSQANQMICRLCQVEMMQIKNGSPYLMGRLDRNGKPVTNIGLPPIQEDEKVQRIRRIAPMTEDYAMDDIGYKRKINEADSNAWREQFTNAMLRQQRGISMMTNNRPIAVSNSTSNSTTFLNKEEEEVLPTNNTSAHYIRYSKRLLELSSIKHTFRDLSVWEAHHRAAIHRQNCLPCTTPTKVVQATITKQPSDRTIDITEPKSMNNSQNNTDEIKTLLGRIRDLENTVSKYREQLDQSSKQIKGLQSILETMKNTKTSVQKQNAAVVSSNKDKVSVQEQQQRQQRRASSSTTGAKNSNGWTNANRRTNASTNTSVANEKGEEGMMRRKVPFQNSDTHKQSFRKD